MSVSTMPAMEVSPMPMAKPRILIIEDERGLTDVLTYNLHREGYETVVAHDGQEGLRKAQTNPPDLILLDLMLPGMDGLEVCRQLRASKQTSRVPILMLTAKGEETDQVVGFSLDKGGTGVTMRVFVSAPFDQYVGTNTRWWHASGVDLRLDSSAFKLNTQSLATVIVGR